MVITPSDVTAVIVTRGDVDITPVLDSLVFERRYVYDNSKDKDMGAFGRYIGAGMSMGVVYFQDDDCIVSEADQLRLVGAYEPEVLTALMPASRTDYTDTVLIGWGSICWWSLPFRAFARWGEAGHAMNTRDFRVVGADFVFPMLTPTKRLDAEHTNLPHAHADNRTWASYPDYPGLKEKFLRDARMIRDR